MMRVFLLFAIGVTGFITSFAGDKNNNASTTPSLVDSCWKYMNKSDTVNSRKYCVMLLNCSAKKSDKATRGNVYRTLGNFFLSVNDYEKSIAYFDKSIQLTENLNGEKDRLLYALCLSDYANIFYKNGDYMSALEKYIRAEKIFYLYKDYDCLADVYNKIAGINTALLRPDKAYEFNKKAYQYGIKTKDKNLLFKVYECYAFNLIEQDSFELANTYLLKALKIAQKTGNKTFECDAYYNMAYCRSEQCDFGNALRLYNKSYDIAMKTGKKSDQCEALYKIGLMYYYLNQYDTALSIMLDVLNTSQYLGLIALERNTYDILYRIEEARGNYREETEYLKKYIDIMYEVYSVEDQQQINFMNGKFQAQKREADIFRLTAEKKMQSEQMRKKNLLIGSFSVLILLMTFTGITLLKFSRQKQKLAEQENEIQKHKIRELENEKMLLATRSLLEGEETERRRMARDLHDGLGGLLSGIKLKLNHMKGDVILSEETVKEFDHALELLDKSIVHLREVAHNMMPETLIKLGLKDALHDVCLTLNESQSIKIEFQHFGDTRRMEQTLEISAYRIVQELVHNAIKHSKAHLITVQLLQEPERLGIIVQDDGKGFDTQIADDNKGMGLKSIKSRIESLKGTMDIHSEPGKGTEIHIEFFI